MAGKRQAKRSRGRPARPMPGRIDATPEEIAKAIFKMPADHQWKCLKAPDVLKDTNQTAPG